MAHIRCTLQEHALTVLAVALLSAAFGGIMEFHESSNSPTALSAPKGNDLKGLRIVTSASWGHLLVNGSDFAR